MKARSADADASRGANERSRGRLARVPSQVSLRGWRDVLIRTAQALGRDHTAMIAAGVAFFSLLALFPALAATISLWGLLVDPAEVDRQLAAVGALLPGAAFEALRGQAMEIASNNGARSLALGSLAATLFTASRGVNALIEGLNVAYNERERRGLLRVNALAIGLTAFLFVMSTAALLLVVGVPALLAATELGPWAARAADVGRWPLLIAGMILTLAVLYHFGPSRRSARWRWASVGAIVATAVWLLASAAFGLYVTHFGAYNETYGTLGGIVILMLWLWLSVFAVLLGAELNNELERQTRHDTTVGRPRPMGERGAYGADTLGPSP